MNKLIFALITTLIASIYPLHNSHAQIITFADFDPWDLINPNGGFEFGSWAGAITQNSGFITVGPGADDTGSLYADKVGITPVDLTTFSLLTITARIDPGNASGGFLVQLVDTGGLPAANITFFATEFTTSFTAVTKPWTVVDSAALADVGGFFIFGLGMPSAFRMSFDEITISVIPEPKVSIFFASIILFLWLRCAMNSMRKTYR